MCRAGDRVYRVTGSRVSCVSCHRQPGSHRPDCCSVLTDQMLTAAGPSLGSQVTQPLQKPRSRYNQYQSQRSPADRDPARLCANYQLRPTASYFQPSPPPASPPVSRSTFYNLLCKSPQRNQNMAGGIHSVRAVCRGRVARYWMYYRATIYALKLGNINNFLP